MDDRNHSRPGVFSLAEARIVIESWCRHCKAERPHASLGYKPRASEVFLTGFRPARATALAPRPQLRYTFQSDHSVGAGHRLT